jgi:chemotaxis protein MotB
MARRKSRKKDEKIKGNFDMLFLQLMMIMMAFFILLSALSVIVENKRKQALVSISGAFSLVSAGTNLTEGSGAAMLSMKVGATTAAPIRTAKKLTNAAKLLGVSDAVDVIPLDKRTVRVRMKEQILFKPGQVELNADIRALISSIAQILQLPEIEEITIEGHTDKTPIRGEGAIGNWELSAARAMQIFLELAKNNTPKSKMVAAGMGDTQPLPVAETNGNEALNRRVELLIRFRPTTAQSRSQPISPSNQTPTSAASPQGN